MKIVVVHILVFCFKIGWYLSRCCQLYIYLTWFTNFCNVLKNAVVYLFLLQLFIW